MYLAQAVPWSWSDETISILFSLKKTNTPIWRALSPFFHNVMWITWIDCRRYAEAALCVARNALSFFFSDNPGRQSRISRECNAADNQPYLVY
jgi:hypothetical protein